MKIIFIGTVRFSYCLLDHLLDLGADVVGIISKKTNHYNSDHKDLTPLSDKYKIPILHIDEINTEAVYNWVDEKHPDIMFCFGWSQLIKRELLDLPEMGVIGYHPALLPKNRGRHPIIWALALGLEYTGSTFFFMNEHADSGDIVSQSRVEIHELDDAGTLYEKLIKTAKKQLDDIYPKLMGKTYTLTPQENCNATYWRKRGVSDGEIDWKQSAESINNLIRALAWPYPGAHALHNQEMKKIWSARMHAFDEYQSVAPGCVVDKRGGAVFVQCGEGVIQLTRHELGNAIEVGDRLI